MSYEPGTKHRLYLTCLFDEIKLHVGDTVFDLTLAQAQEFREVLDGVIEHAERYTHEDDEQ